MVTGILVSGQQPASQHGKQNKISERLGPHGIDENRNPSTRVAPRVVTQVEIASNLGGGFKDFLNFHPYLGEMIQFDGSHIFQIGLVQPPTSNSFLPWIFLHAFNSKLHFVQALFKGKTVLDVGSGHLEQSGT